MSFVVWSWESFLRYKQKKVRKKWTQLIFRKKLYAYFLLCNFAIEIFSKAETQESDKNNGDDGDDGDDGTTTIISRNSMGPSVK